ncbi:MAG: transaldolase [Candidatus Binataceae bacterium]|jgi:transaldolase
MSETANPVRQLESFGQSVWLDYIRRDLLSSAEFRRMIDEDGLDGMTSNPTIFKKAIDGSNAYDEQLKQLARAGKSVEEIYEALTTDDIKLAADKLRPIYDRSEGRTGYVSYEVSPLLANDTDGTIAAARRCASMINRPNLMIKVPSTPAGIPAIEQLISEGRCINVTLMFSLKHYEGVANAYIRGLERRIKAGGALDRIASVASVFVSRVETLVDKLLEAKLKANPDEANAALCGTAAVANAKLIYQRFVELFHSDRFKALAAKGARVQRPLWASTGTKDPKYSDVKYVQELIGRDTVNTMPPATMDAFRDHGKPRLSVTEGVEQAREIRTRLAALGIDLDEVGETLQKEGVESFSKSYEELLAAIKKRRDAIV